ncbi:MAG: TonB-dependent siderophore receptor [Steroidobacteraceae bacterium]
MRAKISLIGMAVAAALAGTARAEDVPSQVSSVDSSDDSGVETILIVGQRAARTSKGATGLEMSLADTPQSETVVDSATMEQFGLTDINSALRLVTGVNVEQFETDRTYYNSRGFDITSVQVDGVGMPFDSVIVGALDSAIYDKIEVVRGANALLTGIGNPSGTVNYVRKRPTNDFQVNGELTVGSWNDRRAVADLSAPLVESGQWAARVVGVIEDKDSYLNLYHNQRKVFYGVIDGQLGERVTLAAGFSHQDNNSDGVMWGSLPLVRSDGSQASYDVSSTTAMNWTYWDTHTNTAFAELGVALPKDWQLKSTLNYTTYREPSQLFYIYGNVDPDTGLGLYSWPSSYSYTRHNVLSDTSLTGNFDLFGRSHEATLGLSLAKSGDRDFGASSAADTGVALPAYPGWDGTELAEPAFTDRTLEEYADTRINRLYGATRLNVTDELKLIAGFNAVDAKTTGVSWSVSSDQKERGVTPYVGLTWRFLPNLNAYASYSDIYQPQYQITSAFKPVGSAKGSSYEAGVKGEWLNKQLLTTLSVFRADQDNFAEFVGYSDSNYTYAFYDGISIRSKGFEFEVAGKPTESLTLQAGYTQLSLKDPDGSDTRIYIPRRTLKLMASWKVPAVTGLEVGANLRWQSAIYNDVSYYNTALDDYATTRLQQGAYGVAGLQGSYQLNRHLQFSLNVDNVNDKKYLNSFYGGDQAFYGEPRSFSASVKVSY